jgi:mono/diheme cytochrome c family protein
MKLFILLLLIGSAVAALAGILVYSGVFNVAADEPHSTPVYAVIEAVRDRSIAARTKGIQVPSLDDPKLVAEAAEHYDAMCVGCHLAPGSKKSELRQGLYPQPPDLTEHVDASPAEMFWVIKHGIKMTAMPAWGKTHDDQTIWGLVAFLQKLPELTADQYDELVQASAERNDLLTKPATGEHKAHTHHHPHTDVDSHKP